MARHLFLRVLVLGSVSFIASADGQPFQVATSSVSYGPDGPWQAVSVEIGSNVQPIDLFPGGLGASYVMNTHSCNQMPSCGAAGIYNPNTSSTASNTTFEDVYTNNRYTIGTLKYSADVPIVLDTLRVKSALTSPTSELTVINFMLALMNDFSMTFGNGVAYPLQAGQLSLGPTTSKTTRKLNASLIPGEAETQKDIPSSSFGLHYGSTFLKQPLSLWLGGYDQQRIIGPVSNQSVDFNNGFQIDLLDIGIGVETGGSPFPFSSQRGLLASKNETISTHLPIYINPSAPYLYLPRSTCNALTDSLPVTYNNTFDLYMWNTTSPAYEKILSSPSYLGFIFRDSTASNANFTINIPFSLLNLTLDTSLVDTPTPYFPCQPPSFGGPYSLGRAFLQAAFLGADWDQTPGQWYLAQAPGPNIATTGTAVAFSDTPSSSTNDWADTWKDNWTPLAGSTTPDSSVNPGEPNTSTHSLSAGAIAGIIIGLIAILALVTVGAVLFRRRAGRRRQSDDSVNSANAMTQNQPQYQDRSEEFKPELDQHELHEMAGLETRPELYNGHLDEAPKSNSLRYGAVSRFEMPVSNDS